jgi:hypothetical protein
MSRSCGQIVVLMAGLMGVSSLWAPDARLLAQAPVRRPKPPEPTVIRLAVDPAAEPRPALKYSFVIPISERKPGNAAPMYYRAILAYSVFRVGPNDKQVLEFEERIDKWQSAPLATFPRAEVHKVVDHFGAFEDLREGASRDECNWEWRLQDIEGPKGFEFLLDEVQRSRGLLRLLAVKARLEIAEGRYGDAVDTLRVGFQFSRDIAKTPIIIPGLVGIAITGVLDDQVHALIGASHSPNLYWALTELPRPLIDLRPPLEFEVKFPSRIFPVLKDPEHALHSPEQWADLISQAYHTLTRVLSDQPRDEPLGWQDRLAATGLALRGYTQAKRDLIAAGYDAATVERMPVGQVIAVDEAQLSRYIGDEVRKWTMVPYTEGWRRLRQADRRLIQNHYLGPALSSREVIPINSQLLPAISAAFDASIRRDISIAADRVIEAIRMQAAHNGGHLPRSLAEITVVPVPNHPRFGTPFPYKVEGGKAILEVRRTTEPPEPMQEADEIFEITIAGNRP